RQGGEESGPAVPFNQVASALHDIDARLAEAETASDFNFVRELLARVRESVRNFFVAYEKPDHSQEIGQEIEKLRDELAATERELGERQRQEAGYLARSQELKAGIESEREATRGAERELYELKARRSELRSQLDAIRAREEKFRLEEEDYKRELHEAAVLVDREVLDFPHRLADSLDLAENRSTQEERRRQIERLKIRLEDMGVEGIDVMEEYKKATEREEFLARELEDLIRASETLRQVIAELQEKLNTEFKLGLLKINIQFQEFFALMFGGGSASLELIGSDKKKRRDTDLSAVLDDNAEIPEEGGEDGKEGIDINVTLPRKKIKGLQMLSGGERALTSIALLFAMSQVNPPPFLILDETDAALDEANSRKYGDMIVALSAHSQLILITHNRETMARAGVLYGVTMGGDGISRLLSIKFDEASAYAK
ncbi:MAG TPA: hypothetical protein VEB60_02895, partial [Candidatus Paceibacterota bacterium]|nr:hypothetical protein [Candidatus Paceibacterota bacterium]